MSWYDEAEYIRRQAKNSNEFFANSLPMIASENVLSPLCREMLITDFHGRYAEGTPGHRYYEGCAFFDLVLLLDELVEVAARDDAHRLADLTLGAELAVLRAAVGAFHGRLDHGAEILKVLFGDLLVISIVHQDRSGDRPGIDDRYVGPFLILEDVDAVERGVGACLDVGADDHVSILRVVKHDDARLEIAVVRVTRIGSARYCPA